MALPRPAQVAIGERRGRLPAQPAAGRLPAQGLSQGRGVLVPRRKVCCNAREASSSVADRCKPLQATNQIVLPQTRLLHPRSRAAHQTAAGRQQGCSQNQATTRGDYTGRLHGATRHYTGRPDTTRGDQTWAPYTGRPDKAETRRVVLGVWASGDLGWWNHPAPPSTRRPSWMVEPPCTPIHATPILAGGTTPG